MTTSPPEPDAAPDAAPEGTHVTPDEPARGMRQLTAEEFSLTESVGGVRGVVETLLPGVVFVVVYIATRELMPTILSALGVSLLAVVVRLVQRTPVTQAFSGVLGVVIGVVWAWRSGEVEDFFLFSLLTNAAYLLACVVSVLVRWPGVGVVVELLRSGLAGAREVEKREDGDTTPEPSLGDLFAGWSAWRRDPVAVRRYALATWFWVALFGVRLAVKTPLYLDATTEWLGITHLVMGVPLWALTLWATWVVVHPVLKNPQRPPHP